MRAAFLAIADLAAVPLAAIFWLHSML